MGCASTYAICFFSPFVTINEARDNGGLSTAAVAPLRPRHVCHLEKLAPSKSSCSQGNIRSVRRVCPIYPAVQKNAPGTQYFLVLRAVSAEILSWHISELTTVRCCVHLQAHARGMAKGLARVCAPNSMSLVVVALHPSPPPNFFWPILCVCVKYYFLEQHDIFKGGDPAVNYFLGWCASGCTRA